MRNTTIVTFTHEEVEAAEAGPNADMIRTESTWVAIMRSIRVVKK